jgi:hypothetical protein
MPNVIQPMLQFQSQLKVFHWNTTSFSQHNAFGKAYDDLGEHIDEFVETFIGKFGRTESDQVFTITLKPLFTGAATDSILSEFESYLKSMTPELGDNTDLLNLRDTILGVVNKLRYMLTLN